MKFKSVLKNFIIPLGLTFVVFFILKRQFLKKNLLEYIKLLTFNEHFISSLFLFAGFITIGFQLKNVFKKSTGINLTTFDTLTLPISQNLWGYIIPFQGAFLYSLVYLKSKYRIEAKSSIAVYLFVILASLFLGGISGVVYLSSKGGNIFQIMFFSFFIICPFLLIMSKWVLNKITIKNKNSIFHKSKQYILNIFEELVHLFKSKRFLMNVFLVDITYVVIFSIWSYWLSLVLGYDIPIIFFLSLGFLMKLHSFAKLTPGNIGVIQLLVAGYFSIFGLDPEIGILISLLQLITNIIFGFPVALIITIISMKSFTNLQSDLLQLIKKKSN